MSTGIEVVLVCADYNKKADAKNKELPVKSVKEIDTSDYPRGIELGDWKDKGVLRVHPHMKSECNGKEQNVDIAIKSRDGSDIKKITLVNGKNRYPFQKYSPNDKTEDGSIYYLPPKLWELNTYNNKYHETITSHYTTVGYETIVVEYKDENKSPQSMELRSEYLQEDMDFWKDLIMNLIDIHHKLCTNDESAISVGGEWGGWVKKQYEETEKLVDKFYGAFKHVEESPVPALIGGKEKIDFNKIKRITPRALIEHEIQHKDKVTEYVYRESLDTYEHRVIKTYLGLLMRHIEIRKWVEESTLEASRNRYEGQISILGKDIKTLKLILDRKTKAKNKITDNMVFRENIKVAIEQKEEIDKYLHRKERTDKWEELSQKLKILENSSLMRSTASINTEPRITNLFAYNEAYSRIFSVIEGGQEEIVNVDYYRVQENYPIHRLHQLYEVWCCIRIVSLFVRDYGFKLVEVNSSVNRSNVRGKEALQKCVSAVLSQRSDLSGSRFVMEDEDLQVTLWYEAEIKQTGENENPFRPDFIMRVKKTGSSLDKLFVFDAKCRGKSCQSAIDLCEVAYKKYIKRLNSEGRIKYSLDPEGDMKDDMEVTGSFIIHCGYNDGSESIDGYRYNPDNYLGARLDSFVEYWIKKFGKFSNKFSEEDAEDFKKWCEWKPKVNNENRLGIVLFRPKEDNLQYLIQMIMEHYFGRYQDRCWLCGNNTINIETRHTKNNYLKYHITCPNCGQFWVETHCKEEKCHRPLGKHTENYYAPHRVNNREETWNVSCPWCRENLTPKKNQQFEDFSAVTLTEVTPSNEIQRDDEDLPFK